MQSHQTVACATDLEFSLQKSHKPFERLLITRITLVALATELWQRREIRSYIQQINILVTDSVHNLLVVFYMPSERDLLVRRLRSFSRLPNRFMFRNNDGGLKYELICTTFPL